MRKKCLVCGYWVYDSMCWCEPCRAANPSNWHKFEQIEIDKNIKIEEFSECEKHLTKKQAETIKSKTKSGKYLFISNTWNLLDAWRKGYVPLLFCISDSCIFSVRKSGALAFVKNIE